MSIIVHLFVFADDVLFFLKEEVDNACELKVIITKYCKVSGQRINNEKSNIVFNKGWKKVDARQ